MGSEIVDSCRISFPRDVRDAILIAHEANVIDDYEIVALYDLTPRTPGGPNRDPQRLSPISKPQVVQYRK